MIGKSNRLKRLFSFHSNKTILLPVDHGVTLGPIQGLERLHTVVEQFANSGKINGIIGHRAIFSFLSHTYIKPTSAILHLSASTRLASCNNKVLIATVEDAILLGADAVSVHVNLGESSESTMLEQLGHVISCAMQYGLPVLAMLYVRKGEITKYTTEDVALCARMAEDIGVDIVKVPYTGSVESFARVIEGCSIPVLIAGGEKINSTEALLTMVSDALHAGAQGISIGRNIFASEHPIELLDALELLIHKNASLRSATMLYTTAIAHKTQGEHS